ncbi:hypothetical protein [Janthinobacterium sp. CAN_S1]|uniref:hypothetical protein n=1 Tax=Janthinobacterium sp. CAN_S1 TaxID=2787725 RepID=UPI0018CB4291
MSRFRWYGADWPHSMRVMAKRLMSQAFDENSVDGFVIDRVRDGFVEARYIERVEFTDTITDPFGNELLYPRIDFRTCEFRISQDGPGLELIDSPRSTQGMLSRLAEAADFSLAVTPLKVDVLAWANLLQSVADIDMLVDSLQIGSMELERDIIAKIIIKGSRDVRDAATVLTNGKRHNLEKIQLRLLGKWKGTILLTNVGGAKIDVDSRDETTVLLRDALHKLLIKTSSR